MTGVQTCALPISFRLTRRFLVLSLAVIGLVSIASSVVLSRFIVSEGLNRDARVSAQFIEKSVLQRHAASYFQAPFEPTAERAEVERFLNDLLWMPDVLRAQLYSASGEQIGRLANQVVHLAVAFAANHTGEAHDRTGIAALKPPDLDAGIEVFFLNADHR